MNKASRRFLSPDRYRITSAAVATTRDVIGYGGQGEAPVRGDSTGDARGQCDQIGQRQGVSVTSRSRRAAPRRHPEDGGGQIGRPHRVLSRPLLQPGLCVGDRHSWIQRCGSFQRRPAERRRAGAAASQPGAVAPEAGAPFPEVCARAALKHTGLTVGSHTGLVSLPMTHKVVAEKYSEYVVMIAMCVLG